MAKSLTSVKVKKHFMNYYQTGQVLWLSDSSPDQQETKPLPSLIRLTT